MRDWSKRVISVMPCTLEDAERGHVRIRMEDSEEEFHLELIKVQHGADMRRSAREESV